MTEKNNSDIALIVKDKIDDMAQSGAIQSLVEKAVEKSIEDAVKNSFTEYGDFSKSIQKAIKDTVKVNLEDLGLAGYNDVVTRIIADKFDSFFKKTATEEIGKQMDELLKAYPEKITVTELAEKFGEYCQERNDNDSGEFTFIVENSDRGYFDLYIDKKADQRQYSCAYQIRCKPEVWAMRINEEEPHKKLFIGPLFGFERFLFHAYTNKVIVELDNENPSNTYGDY